MPPGRARHLALALAAAAAVILSAPFVQQAFTAASAAWGPWFRPAAVAATLLPVLAALAAAAARIRTRRVPRLLTVSLSVVIAAAYIRFDALSVTESFHFVQYGIVAWLFYRAVLDHDDGAVIVLPLLAGTTAGVLDEWFQWFIPIRAGEARDIAIDAAASACGVLFGLGVEPPRRVTLALRRRSVPRVGRWSATAAAAFALFILTVHAGYEVRDPEIGTFLSRYTRDRLASLARDRARVWREDPPVVLRRVSREDQYLAEGLWHVQQRNEAWSRGDAIRAWRANRILEKYFAPVLDTPSYLGGPHRWPVDQAADAAARAALTAPPPPAPVYRYPLYVRRSSGR